MAVYWQEKQISYSGGVDAFKTTAQKEVAVKQACEDVVKEELGAEFWDNYVVKNTSNASYMRVDVRTAFNAGANAVSISSGVSVSTDYSEIYIRYKILMGTQIKAFGHASYLYQMPLGVQDDLLILSTSFYNLQGGSLISTFLPKPNQQGACSITPFFTDHAPTTGLFNTSSTINFQGIGNKTYWVGSNGIALLLD